jgi:hypothetical protein
VNLLGEEHQQKQSFLLALEPTRLLLAEAGTAAQVELEAWEVIRPFLVQE